MFKLYFLIVIICFMEINSLLIGDKIKKYFKSESYSSFQKLWQPHKKSFENAIVVALKDGYGQRDMNIYIRRTAESFNISDRLYMSDGVVNLLLYDMNLMKLSRLLFPQVRLKFPSNAVSVNGDLSKMIIESRYLVLRNNSDNLEVVEQDPNKFSPFTFPQVQAMGNLVIVADGCRLTGHVTARLSGQSVDLGFDTFAVTDCQFNIEISSSKLKLPPVIAPYFATVAARRFERILTKPVRLEMLPILQAAMYTYINTSVILGPYLNDIRKHQDNIFAETSEYIQQLVRLVNKDTVKNNNATAPMKPFEVSWNYNDPSDSDKKSSIQALVQTVTNISNYISITDVTVYGLDTVYSAHAGGPYKKSTTEDSITFGETLRFNSILVNGNFLFINTTYEDTYAFMAEIKDLNIIVQFHANRGFAPTTTFRDWRSMDLSLFDAKLSRYTAERKARNSIIYAYLGNELPNILNLHLYNAIKKLKDSNEKEIIGTKSKGNQSEDSFLMIPLPDLKKTIAENTEGGKKDDHFIIIPIGGLPIRRSNENKIKSTRRSEAEDSAKKKTDNVNENKVKNRV